MLFESTIKSRYTEYRHKTSEVDVVIYEYDTYLYLDYIVVSETHRNRGLGTKFLREVLQFAALKGKPLLAFVSHELGGDLSRLKKWYEAHGFYPESQKINAEYNYNYRFDASKNSKTTTTL